jgi:hypothetical protein
MAVSSSAEQTASRKQFRTLFDSVSRYDLLLALLPLGFLLAGLAHVLVSVPLQLAIAGAALFGLAVTVDALFVHPPSEKPRHSPQ